MSSRKYITFLIGFILSHYSFAENSLQYEEERTAFKYIAYEDTAIFFEQMETFGEDYGKSWLVIPDGNGTAQFAILEKDRTKNSGKSVMPKWAFEKIEKNVDFYFYTNDNPGGEKLDINNMPLSFNASKQTKIIIHGWMASSSSSVITAIRDAYLEHYDVNVIGVDWSYIAKDFIYPNAASATPEVGKYVGTMINSMVNKNGASYKYFHLIGHSLGAHVAGFAGSNTNEKIARITGLDPALPGFQYITIPEGRLDSTDAEFVDVIHTCSGVLGMSNLVGHADFYPNGGTPFQPGCCLYQFPTDIQSCSHSRSHEFFAESIILSKFKAINCQDWEHFKHGDCKKIYSDMGENVSYNARGAYYLKTHISSPFAMGFDGTIY